MLESATGRAFPAIAFAVRGRLYGLEQRGTADLLPWLQRFTAASAVPGLPDWFVGLLNVRGTVQMVVDLGHLLGHGRSDAGDSSRLIFIEHGTAQLGLLVDKEIGVRYLRPDDAPEHALGGPFAVGCAQLENHPVTVLDGAAIIRHVADALRAPAYLT
jgi:purine-binding chemotaxis protein CheW